MREGGGRERERERERERKREREREIDYFLTQDDCVQRCVHTRDAIGHQDGTPDFSGPPTDKIINTECDIRVRPFVRPSVRPSVCLTVHRPDTFTGSSARFLFRRYYPNWNLLGAWSASNLFFNYYYYSRETSSRDQ